MTRRLPEQLQSPVCPECRRSGPQERQREVVGPDGRGGHAEVHLVHRINDPDGRYPPDVVEDLVRAVHGVDQREC